MSSSTQQSGPESLITQVQQPDEYPKGLITSVAPPSEQNQAQPRTITSLQPAATATMSSSSSSPATQNPRRSSRSGGGGGGWLSSLFCCCPPSKRGVPQSGDPEKDHELMNTGGKNSHVEKTSQAAGPPRPTIMKSAVQGQGNRNSRQPEKRWLLKPLAAEDVGKKCLVLDLDETLVHSSFKPVPNADFVIPVEIDNQIHNVYVLKRPGVDVFLQRLGKQFEVVVFTASLAKYADPVLDMLDKHRVVKHRLFREACLHHKGNYVKDLGQLGRDLKDVIILDNSPASYIFHPTNAIPISS
ncbi:hypothetical protein HK101_006792, partial [Irineochytrium annulatum]